MRKGYRLGSIALLMLMTASPPHAATSTVSAPSEPAAARVGNASTGADHAAAGYARRYGISRELAATILEQAREADVDPGLVFGLVAIESRFDPHALGTSGERGLLQLKLATARAYDRGVRPEELFVPETNLRLGLLHLKREVEHFDHDWKLGLLAYNMGRGRVARALDRGMVPRTGYAARVMAHLSEQPL